MTKKIEMAEWSTADVNNLPDSSFAYISPGGKKDSEGKTTPRSLRHLPYKNKDGQSDLPHVRNALARLDQTQIPDAVKGGIRKKLQAILEKQKANEKYFGIFPFEFKEMKGKFPESIHLIPIGTWDHDAYGTITITASDISEFVKNFNAGIRKGVFITAGHEGMQELPAVGWLTKVEARDDGLWGSVEWNDDGKTLLADKAYKFFSPEFYKDYEDPETHQVYRNVLTGGALTKSPYFKELQAVVFSETELKKLSDKKFMTLQLADLVAKKAEEMTEEEKAFVREHAAELNDEQKTSLASVIESSKTDDKKTDDKKADDKTDDGKTDDEKKIAAEKIKCSKCGTLNKMSAKYCSECGTKMPVKNDDTEENDDDGTTKDGKKSGSEKVQISASELKVLRDKADEGQRAFAELKKAKLDSAIKTMLFSESNKNGKFLPKSKDSLRAFVESLTEAQTAKFTAIIAELPKMTFTEIGQSGPAEGSAKAEVEALVNKKITDKKMKYSEALKEVMSENKGLEERYDAECVKA